MAADCRCGTPAFFWTLVAAIVIGTLVATVAGDVLALAAAGAVVAVPLLVARAGRRQSCALPPAPHHDQHESV